MIECDKSGIEKKADRNAQEFYLNKLFNAVKGIDHLEKTHKLFIINFNICNGYLNLKEPQVPNTSIM